MAQPEFHLGATLYNEANYVVNLIVAPLGAGGPEPASRAPHCRWPAAFSAEPLNGHHCCSSRSCSPPDLNGTFRSCTGLGLTQLPANPNLARTRGGTEFSHGHSARVQFCTNSTVPGWGGGREGLGLAYLPTPIQNTHTHTHTHNWGGVPQ